MEVQVGVAEVAHSVDIWARQRKQLRDVADTYQVEDSKVAVVVEHSMDRPKAERVEVVEAALARYMELELELELEQEPSLV